MDSEKIKSVQNLICAILKLSFKICSKILRQFFLFPVSGNSKYS